MKIKLYLDEDVTVSFAQALKIRGVNVLTTQEAGNKGLDDIDQLDFARLHKIFLTKGKTHLGIIISDQLPVGELLKRFMRLWFRLSAEQMKNRLEYLSNWR